MDKEIDFAKNLNTVTHIPVRILNRPGELCYQTKPAEQLPVFKSQDPEYQLLLRTSKNAITDIVPIRDRFQRTYLSMTSTNAITLLGPFLTDMDHKPSIDTIFDTSALSPANPSTIRNLYEELPMLTKKEITAIGNLMKTLINQPIKTAHLSEPRIVPINYPHSIHENIYHDDQQVIESRYREQDQMLAAIASGNLSLVHKHVKLYGHALDVFKYRIPNNPVRSMKNIMFAFNTLCRIAVKSTGVLPIHQHLISEKFSIAIEKQTTVRGLRRLIQEMAVAYCKLAMVTTEMQYSPLIQRVISLIHLNRKVTLSNLADSVGTTPAYLSRKFKSETGSLFTQYLIDLRITKAKELLRNSDLHISEIAYVTGFDEVANFSRAFRKQNGVSPSSYRNQHD
ncbi:helix-turn-helix domain-containing protein [Secundilactobacillus kimchicus]|uniref:helix-turn-helix domain-containing protein n=1 Tax=Secundilactobacillus kimchicus TaxID=528209 RepID=UPI0024A7C624|nr:AraC family transcriptional regulator [Secundilactobacillus kimchicus]